MIASFRSSCLQHSFLRVAVRDRPAVNDRLRLFLGTAVNDRQHAFISYRQYLLLRSIFGSCVDFVASDFFSPDRHGKAVAEKAVAKKAVGAKHILGTPKIAWIKNVP